MLKATRRSSTAGWAEALSVAGGGVVVAAGLRMGHWGSGSSLFSIRGLSEGLDAFRSPGGGEGLG